MAIPLSYLAAILSIGTFALNPILHTERTAGVPVSLAERCPPDFIGDRMDIVVSLGRDGTMWLNNERFDEQTLRWRVADQMRPRWGKIVWIAADEKAEYGDVVGMISKLKQDTPDLRPTIVTRSQTGEFDPAGTRYATTGRPDKFFAGIEGLCIDTLQR